MLVCMCVCERACVRVYVCVCAHVCQCLLACLRGRVLRTFVAVTECRSCTADFCLFSLPMRASRARVCVCVCVCGGGGGG